MNKLSTARMAVNGILLHLKSVLFDDLVKNPLNGIERPSLPVAKLTLARIHIPQIIVSTVWVMLA